MDGQKAKASGSLDLDADDDLRLLPTSLLFRFRGIPVLAPAYYLYSHIIRNDDRRSPSEALHSLMKKRLQNSAVIPYVFVDSGFSSPEIMESVLRVLD